MPKHPLATDEAECGPAPLLTLLVGPARVVVGRVEEREEESRPLRNTLSLSSRLVAGVILGVEFLRQLLCVSEMSLKDVYRDGAKRAQRSLCDKNANLRRQIWAARTL